VKDQNWFAVAIDFVIVVFGVFIGIQVANWNEARADKIQEAAIVAQLHDEFSEIQTALEKQILIRESYVNDLLSLIVDLENSNAIIDDLTVKRALVAARSTGRRPTASAAYLQLTANGDLARLSNEELKQALIRYHARLDRDAFIFPELMRAVIQEMSSNGYVDYDPRAPAPTGASIDNDVEEEKLRVKSIRSYDIEGLRQYEQHYETLLRLHAAIANTDKTQLELADEILAQISEETK
jgi:hypothetical protein